MKLFFQGLLLPDEEPEMAADIMPALLEEKKRREHALQPQDPGLKTFREEDAEKQSTDSR